MKNFIEKLYVQYVNEFLTVNRFAEYHALELEYANRVIAIGRRLNHRKTKKAGA